MEEYIFLKNIFVYVGANLSGGIIKVVRIGPMAQFEDINRSENGQMRL